MTTRGALWPVCRGLVSIGMAIAVGSTVGVDASAAPPPGAPPAAYARAIDLVHADNGTGRMMDQAARIAQDLRRSHPSGGYAEAILAEALSTWALDDGGNPESTRREVLALADAALKLNPRLADAHVARARALARADQFDQARASWQAALAIQPDSAGATFVQADALRRQQLEEEAEPVYLRFIALAGHPARKANGHAWIARSFEAVANRSPSRRTAAIARARQAHADGVALDPLGPWRLVNFAIFLNTLGDDPVTAEAVARKALDQMEFPMARYHLAAARFLQLLRAPEGSPAPLLADAVRGIENETGVGLSQAIAFQGFSSDLELRLRALQARLPPNPR